jgi:hypothetical protein
MKFVVAKRTSPRGEGLGNELLPWAKGWLASQELNAHLVGPSWGLNRRRYSRNFKTSRLDFVLEDALLRLPHLEFTEADYRATRQIDFGAAIRNWAVTHALSQRRSFIVRVGGMWGGYAAIHRARPFLWSRLLASRHALHNIDRALARLDRTKLFVALHLRSGAGEFVQALPGQPVRGMFNIAIPGEWYTSVCQELARYFRDRIQFWFFADRPTPDLLAVIRRFNPAQCPPSSLTECSDLLLMALADLRVCSVSSYSMAASFLAGGPYIWYEPQLTLRDGVYSLWGHEEAQEKTTSPTKPTDAKFPSTQSPPIACSLGTAMDIDDPLPNQMAAILEDRLRAKNPRTNLLDFGCLPQSPCRSEAQNAIGPVAVEKSGVR